MSGAGIGLSGLKRIESFGCSLQLGRFFAGQVMDAAKQSIVVTVDDDALHEIHDVAQRLVEKGMAVTRVLPLTGVIVGTCGHAKQDALQRVRGVLSVEPEGGVQSPPPDAPVQ